MSRLNSLVLCALGTVFLFGCGGDSSITSAAKGGVKGKPQQDAGVQVPAPAPSPTPTPAPAGSVIGTNMEDGYPQLDKVPTNFSLSGMLTPTWGTGEIARASAPGDPGAFRFLCKPSHFAYDDPIVFPGQKGRSHLHMFFGNTLADANSDYTSLRTTGASTCNNALNRSAYWIPALLNGRGQAVLPEYIAIYYKRLPASHPDCQQGKGCIGLPRGLRFVFGRTMSGGSTQTSYFNCEGPGAVAGHYLTLVEAAKNCPVGARIGAVIHAPQCWNGKELDSPDHRSHVSYTVSDPHTAAVSCPSTHPYRIHEFTLGAWFPVDDTLDRSGNTSTDITTWHFASDRMAGMTPQVSGMTFHADWYGAWDDDVLATWLANCIDKRLDCSGGDLGNGTQLSYSAEMNATRPHLVAVPAPPAS